MDQVKQTLATLKKEIEDKIEYFVKETGIAKDRVLELIK